MNEESSWGSKWLSMEEEAQGMRSMNGKNSEMNLGTQLQPAVSKWPYAEPTTNWLEAKQNNFFTKKSLSKQPATEEYNPAAPPCYPGACSNKDFGISNATFHNLPLAFHPNLSLLMSTPFKSGDSGQTEVLKALKQHLLRIQWHPHSLYMLIRVRETKLMWQQKQTQDAVLPVFK